jgi:hypothetical protein
VIASHYADPVRRKLTGVVTLRSGPSREAEAALDLHAGDLFLMLDDSLGWAWGYAGSERRVGYVPSEALAKD